MMPEMICRECGSLNVVFSYIERVMVCQDCGCINVDAMIEAVL